MITKRQAKVLDYIKKYIAKHGYAPSLEEVQKKIGVASVSTAHYHVDNLQKRGFLSKEHYRSRTIEIIDKSGPEADYSLMQSPAFVLNEQLVLDVPVVVSTRGLKSVKATNQFAVQSRNSVLLRDVVEGLRQLPSDSADVVIIDPPYNIGKDFGNNIDRRELGEYVTWSKQWLAESTRILKPTGTLFVYGFSEILAFLSVEIDLPKRWLIWHYTNKNVASLNFWQRSHESIICAWKQKPLFNRDAVREPYTEGFLKGAAGKVRKGTVGRFSKGGKETVYQAHEGGALPRDVIKIPTLAGGAGMSERWFICNTCKSQVFPPRSLKFHAEHETVKHPTQKPLELSRRLIQSCAPEGGGLVVVPFVGSGSECAAAKQLGHSYVGFEINPDYVRMAEAMIQSVNDL